jgi:uncharacterized metal-binding protein YceD (DUF177 family)
MQLKAKDIGEQGVDVDLPITPAWLEEQCPGLEARAAGAGKPLRFTGRIVASGSDFLLRGRLLGGLVVPCSRCLEDARLELDVPVSVLFVEQEASGEDDEQPADDAPDVISFADGVIDLASELREEILLAMPPQVLCQEDCAGLCPVCGGNRNSQPCDCEEKQRVAQSGFAVLAKLKT